MLSRDTTPKVKEIRIWSSHWFFSNEEHYLCLPPKRFPSLVCKAAHKPAMFVESSESLFCTLTPLTFDPLSKYIISTSSICFVPSGKIEWDCKRSCNLLQLPLNSSLESVVGVSVLFLSRVTLASEKAKESAKDTMSSVSLASRTSWVKLGCNNGIGGFLLEYPIFGRADE